jgi:hypothetical protein
VLELMNINFSYSPSGGSEPKPPVNLFNNFQKNLNSITINPVELCLYIDISI